jgi:hypothetical protein
VLDIWPPLRLVRLRFERGRRELAAVCLPVDEREQLDSTLRLHDAIDAELADVERGLSRERFPTPVTSSAVRGLELLSSL